MLKCRLKKFCRYIKMTSVLFPIIYNSEQGWQNLVVTSADKNHELIFSTDGNKVINIRNGQLPEVEYVEGCL